MERYRRRLHYVLICFVVLAVGQGRLPGAEGPKTHPLIGLLVSQAATEKFGPETLAALDLTRDKVPVNLIRPMSGGRFVDRDGHEVSLDRFSVLWLHQGDSTQSAGPLHDAASVVAIHRYLDQGRGLLLSGSAALLLPALKLDTPRVTGFTLGNDRGQSGLVPVCPDHPVFRGLDLDRGTAWMSNVVYPAFATLTLSGNPAGKRLLAQTPGAPENPLVEYQSGNGRAIVLAWQVSPLFREAPQSYRANVERLLQNALAYLADSRQWQPVEGKDSERATKPQPGVASAQFESLQRAIVDLSETFKDRYPKGPEFLRRLASLKKDQESADAKGLDSFVGEFEQLRREALLANPLLDFDRLLLVKRGAKNLGLPQNWQSNSSLAKTGYDNEIAVLSPVRPGRQADHALPARGTASSSATWTCTSTPTGCSSPCPAPTAAGRSSRSRPTARGLRAAARRSTSPTWTTTTPATCPTAGSSSPRPPASPACRASTAAAHVANLYLHGRRRHSIRQLRFDQDHDWCPTVLNNGRVLYLRWEYTDTPHCVHAAPVPHEPRRHRPDGVLRQQLLLAELDLLRPADPRPSDQGRRRSSPGTTACRGWASW